VLTTKTASDITANATDVNGNVAAASSGRQRMISPEAAILFDKAIIARPLNTPEVCNIHVKNTEYYYRWVNARASGGQVYMQRKALGFINATSDDVDVLVGDAVATEGEVRSGDLILMKMQFQRWASHIKANMQRAEVLGNARGLFNKTDVSTDVFSDEKPVRASVSQEPFARNLAKPFIPTNPDALVDGANVANARAAVNEIRNKIQEGGTK
jgi:hypothetical protein